MHHRTGIVNRDQFFTEAWVPLYETFKPVALDKLSLMFLILACGGFFDLTISHQNLDAERYYRLARCIIAIKPPLDSPSVFDVQIQVLIPSFDSTFGPIVDGIIQFLSSFYLQLDMRREEAWISIGISAKMAQTVTDTSIICYLHF